MDGATFCWFLLEDLRAQSELRRCCWSFVQNQLFFRLKLCGPDPPTGDEPWQNAAAHGSDVDTRPHQVFVLDFRAKSPCGQIVSRWVRIWRARTEPAKRCRPQGESGNDIWICSGMPNVMAEAVITSRRLWRVARWRWKKPRRARDTSALPTKGSAMIERRSTPPSRWYLLGDLAAGLKMN